MSSDGPLLPALGQLEVVARLSNLGVTCVRPGGAAAIPGRADQSNGR